MTEDHTRVSADGSLLSTFLSKATLARRGDYQYAYVNTQDGKLRIIASTSNSVNSYSTFEPEDEMDVHIVDDADYHEAMLDLDTFFTFYDFIDPEAGDVTLTFRGEPGDVTSTSLVMEGQLTASLYLPAADSLREQMPLWLPRYFTDEDTYLDDGERELTTSMQAKGSEFGRIADVVSSDELDLSERYPVVVEDGDLRLDVEDEMSRSSVSGTLDVAVSGDDVSNVYGIGFKAVFDEFDAEDLLVSTAPDGAPLCIVSTLGPVTYRHVVSSTGVL